jgi:hypothetical protein
MFGTAYIMRLDTHLFTPQPRSAYLCYARRQVCADERKEFFHGREYFRWQKARPLVLKIRALSLPAQTNQTPTVFPRVYTVLVFFLLPLPALSFFRSISARDRLLSMQILANHSLQIQHEKALATSVHNTIRFSEPLI